MKLSRSLILLLVFGLLAVAAILLWQSPIPHAPKPGEPSISQTPGTTPPSLMPLPPHGPPEAPPLSPLAEFPRWQDLNAWQATISRAEFLRMMEEVFTVSPKWREWFHLSAHDVLINTGIPDEHFRLRFANPEFTQPNPRPWRKAKELGPFPPNKPLADLRIAIDPGHIGGKWAKIEGRWFQVDQASPVKEGDMTLVVAKLLKSRLENLGAEVRLLRETTDPLTSSRPESLLKLARSLRPDAAEKFSEQLFYRTAEIRTRAALVNQVIRPDLAICLHFNAAAWGNPAAPTLVDQHHFHLILNGAYTDSEIALADQRYELLRKILMQSHAQEAAIGAAVASSFAKNSGLLPYLYEPNSSRAVNVNANPYLWARNLLANRLYDCPVVYLEPYVMNSTEDHARIQAGDYRGTRRVHGKLQVSIFREYADSVAEGLAQYYRSQRPTTK